MYRCQIPGRAGMTELQNQGLTKHEDLKQHDKVTDNGLADAADPVSADRFLNRVAVSSQNLRIGQ
ncbi:MAG: hypothetical protein ACK58T_27905, partial [Phycisphaerae bacterium]